MGKAVITGMGIVSCIGNSVDEVTESLKKGQQVHCLRPQALRAPGHKHLRSLPRSRQARSRSAELLLADLELYYVF